MASALDMTTFDDVTREELARRLTEHVLAGALVRKSGADPVPFPVWWRVADALRAAVQAPGTEAVEAVESAMAALAEATGDRGAAGGQPAGPPSDDPARTLHRARLLVARLVFAAVPTSPTLLQVRLARLRRALLAAG